MEVLSPKYPGIMIICQECGAVLGNVQEKDIYGANIVYCPICHHANEIEYDKNYNGEVKENA